MRKAKTTDSVFDLLVKGRDEIIFNLFNMIRTCENATIFTDDRSYIVAQSNEYTPAWVFANDNFDDVTIQEVTPILSDMLRKNSCLKVNGEARYLTKILDQVAKSMDSSYQLHMEMNAYTCYQVKPVKEKGQKIISSTKHLDIMAKLLQEMAYDADCVTVSDEDAANFANAMVNSPNLALWEDEDIVAMAVIANKTNRYARINTVVTERNSRGKGYAGMLVSEMCADLLQDHIIPMLYANISNPYSNAAYVKIGFELQGTINEYRFVNSK